MLHVRPSVPADVPEQRLLWKLAFGDSDTYIDNFYDTYYQPERVLVLEEEGRVRSMTAWFDTTLVLPGTGEFRAAYLYAVATHPDCRGKGLAGRLLAGADAYFRSLAIPVVTTVPAEPSLHSFFGRNGFQECFTLDQHTTSSAALPANPPGFSLSPLSPKDYNALRERILTKISHIAYSEEALTYQARCSVLSGGGLYAADTGHGTVIFCAEGMEDGRLMLKELLGPEIARDVLLQYLPVLLPTFSGIFRCPGPSIPFGMVKWLRCPPLSASDGRSTTYLGFAFD